MTINFEDLSDTQLIELKQKCETLLNKRATHNKIRKSMKLIAQECKKADCEGCPLKTFCSTIAMAGLPLPDEWKKLPE